MRSILLDTSAYSNLLRGNRLILEELGRADQVWVSAIVLGELHQGFRGGTRYRQNLGILREFMADPAVQPLAVTAETAELFGKIKHDLKQAGTPIPINDVWIASQCLQVGAILVTTDHHFTQIPGLQIWEGLED